MSELYVPLALLGTFGAVILGGLVVDAWLARRRKVLDVLRSQVKEVGFDVREGQLAEPFLERVVGPALGHLGELARRMTPVGMRRRIARQLVLAGSRSALDPDKVAAFKLFGAIGGAIAGFVLALLFGLSGVLAIACTVFFAFFCYLIPGAGLGQKAISRQETIQRAMPDTMDLLTISVEAGLGFDAALAHVRRNVPGPLSDEIGRMLQEIQLGEPRVEAFKHLAERTDVDELRAFVLAMTQADVFGVSVGKVLRSQSKDLRIRRKHRFDGQLSQCDVQRRTKNRGRTEERQQPLLCSQAQRNEHASIRTLIPSCSKTPTLSNCTSSFTRKSISVSRYWSRQLRTKCR